VTIKEAETGGRLGMKLIDSVELAKELNVCTKTLKQWVAKGEFPRPRLVQARKVLWSVADVRAFLGAEKAKGGGNG
jgi:predicted DNA-binding transcriptional regulator AlpA